MTIKATTTTTTTTSITTTGTATETATATSTTSTTATTTSTSTRTTTTTVNTCTCADGTPATGAACTADGAELCTSCNTGFVVSSDRCQEVDTVAVSLTVQGIDYNALQASASALPNFNDAIARGIADVAGVPSDRIDVRASQGSVQVDATITPPVGVTASSLQPKVADEAKMQTAVAAWLRLVDLGDAVVGSLKVGGIVASVVEAITCICASGYPATGEACTTDGAAICAECFAGFTLNNIVCRANFCFCSGGTPATGAACTTHSADICAECFLGFNVTGGRCEANRCRCANGVGATGGACPAPNDTVCASCDEGFALKNSACEALKAEEEPPPAAAVMVEQVKAQETALVQSLLVANTTSVTSKTESAITTAQKLSASDIAEAAKASGKVVVEVQVTPDEESEVEGPPAPKAKVAVPSSVFSELISGLGEEEADAGVIVVVTAFDPASIPVQQSGNRDTSSKAPGTKKEPNKPRETLEVKAAVNINLALTSGGFLNVENLAEPILVSLPVNRTREMECAYWNEETKKWVTDGLAINEDGPVDGPLVCETRHLSLFAGIVRGFANALTCSQVNLLNAEAIAEIAKGDWCLSVAAFVFWGYLGLMSVVMATACVLDRRRRRKGHVDDEYFLIPVGHPPAPPPEDPKDAAEEEEKKKRRGWRNCCCCALCALLVGWAMSWAKSSAMLRDALDEVLNNWCEFLGEFCSTMRTIFGSMCGSSSAEDAEGVEGEEGGGAEEEPRERPPGRGVALATRAAHKLLMSSARRSVGAALGISHEAVVFLMEDPDLCDLLLARQARGEGDEVVRAVLTEREEMENNMALYFGPADPTVDDDASEDSAGREPPICGPALGSNAGMPSFLSFFVSAGSDASQPRAEEAEAGPEAGVVLGEDVVTPRAPAAVEAIPTSLTSMHSVGPEETRRSRASASSRETRLSRASVSSRETRLSRASMGSRETSQLSRAPESRASVGSVGSTISRETSQLGRAAASRASVGSAKSVGSRPSEASHWRRNLTAELNQDARLRHQSTVSSVRASAREESWRGLHQSLGDSLEKHIRECSNCRTLPKVVARIYLLQNPIGAAVVHSNFMSSSLRTLFFLADGIGALMLECVFFEGSGSVKNKNSSSECMGEDSEEVGVMIGRIMAIGLSSLFLATLPRILMGTLHHRKFRKFEYEGCPEWKRQLNNWRIQDRIIWILGLAYCSFCAFFIMLFLANVSTDDHVEFAIVGSSVVIVDLIVVPFAVALFVPTLAATAMSLLSFAKKAKKSSVIQERTDEMLRINSLMAPAPNSLVAPAPIASI